ncbi:UNVERIFIED_CONTAM: BlaI/MecI/CopY family transcriptional regulator [Actinomycetes bacterium ARC8]|uniref:BlaI/MecI/CopY family transcriptional regulator n=1 Tax=Glutamicibacter arilaitensis TaxID=256701 RepID=UPI00293854B8|nr:BlaI/MecI/CopY family transcriptional regulator [Actinomycetes bacterium ARC8]
MSTHTMRLGPLEIQVMEVLWSEKSATIRQVITILGQNHAYTTIATVLGNLERKTLVHPLRGHGRTVQYEPTCSREQHAAQLMGQALESSGDRALSIQHFVQNMSANDINLLREFLEASTPGIQS